MANNSQPEGFPQMILEFLAIVVQTLASRLSQWVVDFVVLLVVVVVMILLITWFFRGPSDGSGEK